MRRRNTSQIRRIVDVLEGVERFQDQVSTATQRVMQTRRDRREGVIIMREASPGVFVHEQQRPPRKPGLLGELLTMADELEQLEGDLNDMEGGWRK